MNKLLVPPVTIFSGLLFVVFAQTSGVMDESFNLTRIFELIGSAGVIGVLIAWLFDTRRQLEAQRQMFLKELETERIAHESTRRMLIDLLKEQRPVYGHYESSTKPLWADRAHAPRATGMLEGD